MFPLAESEKERILTAFNQAEKQIQEAATAMQALREALDRTMACVDQTRIDQLGRSHTLVGAALFELRIQRYRIRKTGFDREWS
jgi:hypothetical protein